MAGAEGKESSQLLVLTWMRGRERGTGGPLSNSQQMEKLSLMLVQAQAGAEQATGVPRRGPEMEKSKVASASWREQHS
jgi:hypothetical protein